MVKSVSLRDLYDSHLPTVDLEQYKLHFPEGLAAPNSWEELGPLATRLEKACVHLPTLAWLVLSDSSEQELIFEFCRMSMEHRKMYWGLASMSAMEAADQVYQHRRAVKFLSIWMHDE
jgi:hypothetical protein